MNAQAHDIIGCVTEAYLDKREPLSADQIAERLGWSESKVRRLLNQIQTSSWALERDVIHRESYSRDYPSMQFGYHKVAVWSPSKEHLVSLIKSYQHSLELEIAENNKRALQQARQ